MERSGFEADDVIATLVKLVTDLGWEVLVVTGDRDSFQLVSPTVRVVYTLRGISDTVVVDPEWVEGKYGVRPGQYLDYASLRGDTSDNLPGVPGVGEKTAARLLSQFDDLEGVFSHLESFPPRLRSNLTTHREQVLLNRELIALVDDLDLEVDEDRLRRGDLDWPSIQAVFDRLEFATLWKRLTEQEGRSPPVAEDDHRGGSPGGRVGDRGLHARTRGTSGPGARSRVGRADRVDGRPASRGAGV